MRRITPLVIALALLLSVVGMTAPKAEAHARYPGTWRGAYYWIWYDPYPWCGNDGYIYQWQQRWQQWQVYDWNYGYWINDHSDFITSWLARVGTCNQHA